MTVYNFVIAATLFLCHADAFFLDYGELYDNWDPFSYYYSNNDLGNYSMYDIPQDYYDVYDDENIGISPDYANVDQNSFHSDQDFNYLQFLDDLIFDTDLLEDAVNELLSNDKEFQSDIKYYNSLIPEDSDKEALPVLSRRKRAVSRKSSSSRSRSSSSSRDSSSRKSSTSDRSPIYKPKPSSTSTSVFDSKAIEEKNKHTYTSSSDKEKQQQTKSKSVASDTENKPAYPTGSYPPKPGYYPPKPGYPSEMGTSHLQPKPGYPSGTGTPVQPDATHHGGLPQPGYPGHTNPSGLPQPGYPGHTYPGGLPQPGYPGHTNPSGLPQPGYPGHTYPGGLPQPGYYPPKPGYPSEMGTSHLQPKPGYPSGTGTPGGLPQPGYPGHTYPGGLPQPGYPGQTYPGGLPKPGYPGHAYPGGVQGSGHQYGKLPSHSAGTSHTGSGFPHLPGTHSGTHATHLLPGFSPHKPNVDKKKKVQQLIKHAVEAYATYKLNKKKKKYLSPSKMPGLGFGGFGAGGHHDSMKLGKQVIGTMMKLQIAKYAMKYGAKAAKAYFEHKLHRSLTETAIEKFITRYHISRTRNLFRNSRSFKKYGLTHAKNVTLGEECARKCKAGDKRICFFSFQIHLYQSLSRACYKCPTNPADCERPECVVGSGRRKLITVVNKQLPGPHIQVCEGDSVLLEVQNELPSSGITLHFRGQTFPKNPGMDGTPGLTQCLISPGNSFTYSFVASEPGTYFWHAQTGILRSEGVYGPFIVQELNPQAIYPHLYDIDLTKPSVIVSEELEKSGQEEFINLYHRNQKIQIHSILVNGKGATLTAAADARKISPVMYSRIAIMQGKRHRIRLISAVSSNCPMKISLLGQSMSVIAIDGSPVTPTEVKAILPSPGERYDVVLGPLAKGLYWMKFKGFLDCRDLLQYAVIESQDAVTFNSSQHKPMLNHSESSANLDLPKENLAQSDSFKEEESINVVNCNSSTVHCSRNFTSPTSLDAKLRTTPNITLYFSLTSRRIHNEHFYSLLYYNIKSLPLDEQILTPQVNNLTLKLPPIPLLINEQPLKRDFCSTVAARRLHCVADFCECIHLQELPLNITVDLVLINEGKENSYEPQTMYFHGHKFWVLSEEKSVNSSNHNVTGYNSTFDSQVESQDESLSGVGEFIDRTSVVLKDTEGQLKRNLVNPVRKDCVTVPGGGYSVIRFETKNPGFWLLESSSVFKSSAGMGVVFRIGRREDVQGYLSSHNHDC